MRAGKLDRTITIERDTATVDDYGTPTTTSAVVATARAQLLMQNTEEFIRGFGASDQAVVIFRTRWIAGLTNADRVIFEGRSHNVKEIKPLGRDRGLEIRTVAYSGAA